jgi:hypothetical protein
MSDSRFKNEEAMNWLQLYGPLLLSYILCLVFVPMVDYDLIFIYSMVRIQRVTQKKTLLLLPSSFSSI